MSEVICGDILFEDDEENLHTAEQLKLHWKRFLNTQSWRGIVFHTTLNLYPKIMFHDSRRRELMPVLLIDNSLDENTKDIIFNRCANYFGNEDWGSREYTNEVHLAMLIDITSVHDIPYLVYPLSLGHHPVEIIDKNIVKLGLSDL